MGRFINADAFISTGQGLLGNNMFAYCLNNPAVYVDPTGRYGHEFFAASCYDGSTNFGKKSNDWLDNIREDINNFDLRNASEEKVLASNYFSMYKGVLVFRTNGNHSGSLGMIFLTNRIIYELKPNNSRAIRQGWRQLTKYTNALESDGSTWIRILVTYD